MVRKILLRATKYHPIQQASGMSRPMKFASGAFRNSTSVKIIEDMQLADLQLGMRGIKDYNSYSNQAGSPHATGWLQRRRSFTGLPDRRQERVASWHCCAPDRSTA
jgi:hypothetical protein